MAIVRQSRVVLAEDHKILREGLRRILDSEPDLAVVGEAADGREAIRCASELRPDMVVLDLSMPRMNGLEALREIRKTAPGTRVLVLTAHKTEEYVHAALQAGAAGYVLKDSASSELLLAVRSVLAGERYIGPQVVGQLIAGYLGAKSEQPAEGVLEGLSQREREVLKLVAEGYRNREIGDYLCISEKTVEKHRASLMKKLNLQTVQALTAFAMKKGLVTQ